MHENQGSTATHFSVNGANYQKETQSSNGQYWVVCQVDNTFIYVNVSDTYKADIDKALETLGY